MFVAIREVLVLRCEAVGVKDRLRGIVEELLPVFTDDLELTLGGFLVELTLLFTDRLELTLDGVLLEETGDLAGLLCTGLLGLDTAGER